MPHHQGSLIQVFNDERQRWETARCRWVSAGTFGGERHLALLLMRPSRRSRKLPKVPKSRPSVLTDKKKGTAEKATAAAEGIARRTSAEHTEASPVVAQMIVAYVRPRAAAAPLSSELRAALQLKVVSVEALLYSSHQSTPRNAGLNEMSSGENSPPMGPQWSAPVLHAPLQDSRRGLRGDEPDTEESSPDGSVINASMSTAPFYASTVRPRAPAGKQIVHDAATPLESSQLHTVMPIEGTRKSNEVDHWREVLELEVVGALRLPPQRHAAPNAAKARRGRARQTEVESLASSFSSNSEAQLEKRPPSRSSPPALSATAPPRIASPKSKQKLRRTNSITTNSSAHLRKLSATTTPTVSLKKSASAVTSKPKWRQRMLGWLKPSSKRSEKSSGNDDDAAGATGRRHSAPPGTAVSPEKPSGRSRLVGAADPHYASQQDTRRASTPSPSHQVEVSESTSRSSHSLATRAGTAASSSDLQFLRKRAVAASAPSSAHNASPSLSASSDKPPQEGPAAFPPAQEWTTVRLRCRHQRHLFQLLHEYVAHCRSSRVDIDKQFIAEQRHADARCSQRSTPAQTSLHHSPTPLPGLTTGRAPPSVTSLSSSSAGATTSWMLQQPLVHRVEWVPYVEHLTDPRNSLPFGRIPPFLWYALSAWSNTALYCFDRGHLALAHQRDTRQRAREVLQCSSSDSQRDSIRSAYNQRPSTPSAVLAPVHAISSHPSPPAARHLSDRGGRSDSVTLIVSANPPLSMRNQQGMSAPQTPRGHGRPKLTSPSGPREPSPLSASYRSNGPATERDAGSADGGDVCTSFRDCFIVLLETHVVFMDSFGDVKFHCSMDELEAITYSETPRRDTGTSTVHAQRRSTPAGKTGAASTGDTSKDGRGRPLHDVPPFYPFLCFHVKGGHDEEEEPPLSAAFTFLPLIPASVSANVDDGSGPMLCSPCSPDLDNADQGSPFARAPPDSGSAVADQFTAHNGFDDEHRAPAGAAAATQLDWHLHSHLCRRQSQFLDAFLALTSRTIVSETVEQYLKASPTFDSPGSPLGVVTPTLDRWPAADYRQQPPLHMVELAERDLTLVLPSRHRPPLPQAFQAQPPSAMSASASDVGGDGPDLMVPAFVPNKIGTSEALELLPLSLRLARHPLPILLEKEDLFLEPLCPDDDDDENEAERDGNAPQGGGIRAKSGSERGQAGIAPSSPDGGQYAPRAPQKRRSQLKRNSLSTRL